MAEIDSNIPLSAGRLGFDLAGALQIGKQAQELQLNRQKMQQQNALSTLLSDPRSYQPNSTQLNPNALRLVAAADPNMGLSLQQQYLNEQIKRSQDQHYQTETGKMKFDFMTQTAGVAYDAYSAAKAAGRSEQDAQAAGRAARAQFASESGGLLTDEEAKKVQGLPFDPMQVKAFASANKEWAGLRTAESKSDEQERHDRAMERLGQQRINIQLPGAGASPNTIQDQISLARAGLPKNQIVAGWGNKASAQWQQIESGAIQQILSENPGMKRDEAARMFASEQQGYKADTAAITQMTKDLASIRPFERMLDQNADIAIKLGEKAVKTDSKLANKTLNWLSQNVASNPDVSEYLAQMRFVQTEAARVLNNPRLVGQMTDAARHEMDQVVSGDMPLEATKRVLSRIKNDAQRRIGEMEKEKKSLFKGSEQTSTSQPMSLEDYLKSQGH